MRSVEAVFETLKVILAKAKNLKQIDQYNTVYVSPDRLTDNR
jgi:hypothetical protein